MEKSGNIQLEIPDFSNSVLSHLNQLRMQGRLCDIVVNVQGQAFRAHKVVLAASSPYFRDHMSLNEMSTVSISVIKNPSVFEQLLSFCYTGRICLQLADIISYLTAASFLQMQHIIDKCTQILEGIHFKINVAEVEAELSQTRTKHQERPPESHRVTPNLNRSLSPRHNTPKGSRLGQVSTVLDIRELSPPEESTSPQIIEQSSDVEGREPILRINRAGQWYVETGMGDHGGRNDDDVRVLGGVRIKTENLEEWLGAEHQPSGEDGSSAEEVTAMVIDTTGHGSMGQEAYALGSSGAKVVRPTSSEIDRFSPSGSMVAVTERYRSKSESPGRMDEPKQPSSQVGRSRSLQVNVGIEDDSVHGEGTAGDCDSRSSRCLAAFFVHLTTETKEMGLKYGHYAEGWPSSSTDSGCQAPRSPQGPRWPRKPTSWVQSYFFFPSTLHGFENKEEDAAGTKPRVTSRKALWKASDT
uniref:Zinc finger and BTB domain containing 37 n=1 Tax=Falco tinnunculus TaxID=100819 RepID=A0A8C4VE87_FALTI